MSAEQPIPSKIRKKRRRLTFLGIVLMLLLFWSSSLWINQQEVIAQKQQELDELKQVVVEANDLQIELSYQIKRLQDSDYIAEVARRDYFLSRPGEVIFKVPNN